MTHRVLLFVLSSKYLTLVATLHLNTKKEMKHFDLVCSKVFYKGVIVYSLAFSPTTCQSRTQKSISKILYRCYN